MNLRRLPDTLRRMRVWLAVPRLRSLQWALLAALVVAIFPGAGYSWDLTDRASIAAPTAALTPITEARMAGTERAVAGKGSWFLIFGSDWTDADPERAAALVESAVAADLTHLYVRVADSQAHFYAATALRDLLPAAHQAGLHVLGWIEPTLDAPLRDAADAIAAATFRVDGLGLEGLTVTVEETPHETDADIDQYLRAIRLGFDQTAGLGDSYLLIGSAYPLPSQHRRYGYPSLSRWCQILAPLAYWRATGRPEYSDQAGARSYVDRVFREMGNPSVNPFARPLSIAAQAYDAQEENGTPGAPPAGEMIASLDATIGHGGFSWSFYRLADASNGVTAEETAAIATYARWHRPGAGRP